MKVANHLSFGEFVEVPERDGMFGLNRSSDSQGWLGGDPGEWGSEAISESREVSDDPLPWRIAQMWNVAASASCA